MARVIKFPLTMKSGVEVRTLDELRENFDIESVLEYFTTGRLKIWLQHRNLSEELQQIEKLEKLENKIGLINSIYKVFDIENHDSTNIEIILKKNDKLMKLRESPQFEYLVEHIDFVAFNQDEMVKILNRNFEEVKTIFLYENMFNVTDSHKNIKYEGLNNSTILLKGCKFDGQKNNISFSNLNITSDSCIKANFKSLENCILDKNKVKLGINYNNLQLSNKYLSKETTSDLSKIEVYGNIIIHSNGSNTLNVHYVDEGITEEIVYISGKDAFCVHNGILIYFDNWNKKHDLCYYDLKLKKIIKKVDLTRGYRNEEDGPRHPQLIFTDGNIITIVHGTISSCILKVFYCDFKSGQCIRASKSVYDFNENICMYKNKLYSVYRSSEIISEENKKIKLHDDTKDIYIGDFVINNSKIFALGRMLQLETNEVGVFDLDTGKLIKKLEGPSKFINYIKVFEDKIFTYSLGSRQASSHPSIMEMKYSHGHLTEEAYLEYKGEHTGEIFIWDANTLDCLGNLKVDFLTRPREVSSFGISNEKIIVGHRKYESRYLEAEFYIYE